MHRASYLCWWFGKNSFADKHPTFHRSLAWVQTLDWTRASFQSKPGKCTSGKDHNFGLSRLWIWGNSGSLLRWKPEKCDKSEPEWIQSNMAQDIWGSKSMHDRSFNQSNCLDWIYVAIVMFCQRSIHKLVIAYVTVVKIIR